jgi:hypothetical protein
MSQSATPIILALAAVMNYVLAAVIWYFSSRSDEYLALMKRIQPPQVYDHIREKQRGQVDVRKARAAAVICAAISTALLIAAGYFGMFKA